MKNIHSQSIATRTPLGKSRNWHCTSGDLHVISSTILYEMITRKYPFSSDAFGFSYESEVVLFKIGRGERQQFKATDVPKQLKVATFNRA